MAFHESAKRSIVKSITFRILVMLGDGLIIYTITKKADLALSIILLSNLSSTIIYYVHERAWNKVKWGRKLTALEKIISTFK